MFSRLPQAESAEPENRTLTLEQFESLPELIYHSSPDEDGNETDSSDSLEETDDPERGEVSTVSSDSAALQRSISDESLDEASDPELGSLTVSTVNTATLTPVPQDDGGTDKHDQPTSDAVDPSTGNVGSVDDTSHMPCRWSECSICIDAFQPGETLTVLPRCQHAFHKECIKPWLLERLWCCPLCKTSVLKESEAPSSPGGSTHEGSTDGDNVSI